MKEMILKPRSSEKSYGLSQNEGSKTYVFEVPAGSTKQSVAAAVAAQFSVGVISVRMLNQNGKVKMTYRKRSRGIKGRRSDAKKAYVTLKTGESLPVFAAAEDAAKAEETRMAKASKDKK